MIKKVFSSAIAGCLLCCTITAPFYAASPYELADEYMISDASDYGEQIYAYSNNPQIYQASGEEDKESSDDIPINENIKDLDESVVKVMIDPGHYGYYNPSPVYSSYYESVMNWKLSNYLKAELEALGAHADLTKTSLNDNPDLIPRGNMSKGYDFFISIHSNAASYSSIDKPVAICYQNLEWTTIDDTSREIGQLMADKVAQVMNTRQGGEIFQRLSVEDRDGNGVWDDEWYGVLCGARYVGTPGILLEHSFHTNYRATVWLSNDSNLQLMAKEEAVLIYNYFSEKKAEELAAAAATTTTTTTTAPVEETTTETTTVTVRQDPIPHEDGISGDVDGDGLITLTDAMMVLEYYAKLSAGMEAKFIQLEDNADGEALVFRAADIVADECININDATEILRIYAETASGLSS